MTTPTMALAAPETAVDWLNSGTFAGAHDDVTNDTICDRQTSITVDMGMDQSQALRPPMAGAADWTLQNEDRTYSQEWPSSPLYQVITPGKGTRVRARNGVRGTYRAHGRYNEHDPYRGRALYGLHYGRLADISQTTQIGRQRVALAAISRVASLRGQIVNVATQTNIRTDQAIGLILDAAGWPAAARAISTGDTTLLYFWVDQRDAWDAITEVCRAEGPCQLWEDGDGILHFEGRNYRAVTTRSTDVQASFYTVDAGPQIFYRDHGAYRDHLPYRDRIDGYWFVDLAYEPNYKNVVNRAIYNCTSRQVLASDVVWNWKQPFALGPSASLDWVVKASDPFLNPITPVLGTDYTLSAGSVAVSLIGSYGPSAHLVWTAGAAGCTVAGPGGTGGWQLRAQSLDGQAAVIQDTVDTTDSIAKFGTRTLTIDGWAEVDLATAASVASAIVTRRSVQRPQVTLKLINVDADHIRQILELMPSDRIRIGETFTGLDADFWVERKKLTFSEAGGAILECELGCEKVSEGGAFVWEGTTSLWDTASWSD